MNRYPAKPVSEKTSIAARSALAMRALLAPARPTAGERSG